MPHEQYTEEELGNLPSSLYDQYRRTRKILELQWPQDEIEKWARQGLSISGPGGRAWEAAQEYFKASQRLCKTLNHQQLLQWGEIGGELSKDSKSQSLAYFRSSPATLVVMDPKDLMRWTQLGQSLYNGTWKSSQLSETFFTTTPALLDHLNFKELDDFAQLLLTLSKR